MMHAFIQASQQVSEEHLGLPVLQKRKLRHKEVKQLAWGHTDSKWESQEGNPDLQIPNYISNSYKFTLTMDVDFEVWSSRRGARRNVVRPEFRVKEEERQIPETFGKIEDDDL